MALCRPVKEKLGNRKRWTIFLERTTEGLVLQLGRGCGDVPHPSASPIQLTVSLQNFGAVFLQTCYYLSSSVVR